MTNHDLYAGDDSSGLLNHYVGRVKRSFWSTMFAETQGQANQDFAHTTMLFWQNDVLDILQANYSSSGPPTESSLSSFGIGNGWLQLADDPNMVFHEDDQPDELKLFHSNTALMKFVHLISGKNTTYEKAVVLDGDDPSFQVDLAGVRAIHAQKGVRTLRDATIWENMIFEFRGLGFPTRRNPDPSPRTMPVRFLGYDESDTPALDYSNGPTPTVAGQAGGQLGDWSPTDRLATALPAARADAVARLWGSAASVEAFEKQALVLLKNDDDATAALVEFVAGLSNGAENK